MDEARAAAAQTGLVTEQRDRQRVLHERLVEVGDHLGRGGRQAGEQIEHAGMDVDPGPGLRHGPLGEVEEVVALVAAEAQGPGQRREHLLGGLGAGAALELVVVVDRHPSELRDLVPSQSRNAPSRSGDQADVVRSYPVAARPEERAELVEPRRCHAGSVPHAGRRREGTGSPGSAAARAASWSP